MVHKGIPLLRYAKNAGIYLLRRLTQVIVFLLYAPVTLWCIAALYYSNIPWLWGRIVAATLFLLAAVGVWFLPRRWQIPLVVALPLCVILYWHFGIRASNDRDWKVPVERTVTVQFTGDTAHICNIRNFHYRSEEDYDIAYFDADYDIAAVKSVDLAVVHWDNQAAIAHTMLSFGFDDGRHLVLSAETRLEKGESYNTLKGFFKQFELIYVWGTEADLFGLRTNFRHEQLYLYPTTTTREAAQLMFRDALERTQRLAEHPVFYNTLTDNCTTSLLPSVTRILPDTKFDIRILLNGFSDRYAYEHEWLPAAENEDFPTYKFNHLANTRVSNLPEIPPDYSQRIRNERRKN